MSIQKAIEDLIDELKKANETGSLGGGSSTSSRRSSSTGSDNEDDEFAKRRKRKEREKLNEESSNKIKGILQKTMFSTASRALELFETQVKNGLTLDQTDINTLLDPVARQLDRLATFRIAEAGIFKAFGVELKNLGDQFQVSRKELEEFGTYSEDLYGSAETGQKNFHDLTKNYGAFLALTKRERAAIGATTMAMEKLGFETSGMATILDNSTRSLGMSSEQSNQTLKRLASLRKEFNIGAGEITNNYILAQDKLIYNSARVNRVFAELQRTSRVSGVEFSTLIDRFGEGFDTFEGSAAKAGGLNALLGGNIFNSLEFLEMDEAQRLGTIVERIRGNVNVNALISDKFNLKAVANQLGLNPDQTRRLLLGETSVTKALEKAIPSGETAIRKANVGMAAALTDMIKVFEDARGPLSALLLETANKFRDIFTATKPEDQELGIGGAGVLNLVRKLDATRRADSGFSILAEGLNLQDRFRQPGVGVNMRGAIPIEKFTNNLGDKGAEVTNFAAITTLSATNLLGPAVAALTVTNDIITTMNEDNAATNKQLLQLLNQGFRLKSNLLSIESN